jgi:filamentous hemagglutinin family protein
MTLTNEQTHARQRQSLPFVKAHQDDAQSDTGWAKTHRNFTNQPAVFQFHALRAAKAASFKNLLLAATVATLFATRTSADVTPDATLGTEVTTGPTFTISAGYAPGSGTNVFHSFEQFSLAAGQEANFTCSTCSNFIGRVTGPDASNISGTISTNVSNANVFLINPNGVIWNDGAKFDGTGVFAASTASSIRFADSKVFAVNGASEFSTASPAAFGFLDQGSTAEIAFGGGFINDLGANRMSVNGTLELSHKLDIVSQNAKFIVPANSRIQTVGAHAVSVTTNSDIEASTGVGTFPSIATFSSNLEGAGDISIRAHNLTLADGAKVQSITFGDHDAGDVTVQLVGNLIISGRHPTIAGSFSGIGSEAYGTTSVGNTGNLQILANEIAISNRGFVSTITRSLGNSGSIGILAEKITITGDGSGFFTGVLANSDTQFSGRAGEVLVDAHNIILSGYGARISSTSVGPAVAGNIWIGSQDVVDTLSILDGAIISTATFGDGDAGSINLGESNPSRPAVGQHGLN